MKKAKLFTVISVLCVTLFASFALIGCGGGNIDKYEDSISELRDALFAAESAEYKVTAISGVREDPYIIDGVSGAKCDFTVITVVPSSFQADRTYRYKAEIDGVVYEGDLLPHPFAQSLSADIPAAAKSDFILTVTGASEQNFEMKSSVSGDLISAEKALTIALERMKSEIKRFKSGGKLNCEIYVRLMENPIDGSGGYYWYVAFVGAESETVAVLLRGDTGAVAATRV